MSFNSFLVLTSLSAFLFLHCFSSSAIVPPNNSKQIISDVATTSRTIPNTAGPVQKIFDHFWLDVIWPFGYCSKQRRNCATGKKLPEKFGIHGLWPVDRNGSVLKGSGSDIDIKALLQNYTALLQNMVEDWPNFQNYTGLPESYYEFWKHEWSRHGTACPKPINDTPINYFNTTINIYRKLKLMDDLKNNSITPNSSKFYEENKFRAAIQSSNGNNSVILRCNNGKNSSSSRQILESVVLCVASNASTFIPCDGEREIKQSSCDNATIIFLSDITSVSI